MSSNEKMYGIKIEVTANSIAIIWGGELPKSTPPGSLNKDTMKLELSVTRIFHKVLNKGKKELLEIFEKNDFEVLGNMLFKILCNEEAVRTFLYERLALISRDTTARCRIFLEFDQNAYDLASLPWEYLRIQGNPEKNITPFFWGAGMDIMTGIFSQYDLIRYVKPDCPPLEQPVITESQHLSVLLVINNPVDKPVDKTRLVSCFENIRDKNETFDLYYDEKNLLNPPVDNLKEKLKAYFKTFDGPYVLHFLGHAEMKKEQQSVIYFTDKNGNAEEIKSEDFAELFDGTDPEFRLPVLIVLQACESGQVGDKGSGIAFSVAKKGIPAIVAMQNEITEDASENFIKQFYKYLLKGDDVARAVTKARTYMAINYNKDQKKSEEHYSDNTFGAPVVYMSAESPFNLLPPEQKPQIKKNKKRCKNCGFIYEDTTLELCQANGGRCHGQLEPVENEQVSVKITALSQSKTAKIDIGKDVLRNPSAN